MEEVNRISPAFSYDEFTGRNIGFITPEEQALLHGAEVFVCGTGGMGGACLQALVRAGVGAVTIADFDDFELSNLNRQVFAFKSTVGQPKAEITARFLRDINPALKLEIHGADWPEKIDGILERCKIIVNGMDDIGAGIHLYRRARTHDATVIDAYTAPLPSVTVVRPQDPRPEERLRYPSLGLDWRDVTSEMRQLCFMKEIEYVMTNSSSVHHVQLAFAAEMVSGKRKRMSFAPMVITTGNLMAFEAINLALRRRSGTDYRGYFFNPWTCSVERPRSWFVAQLRGYLVRRFLDRLMHGA